MGQKSDNSVYVNMMSDSLTQKEGILKSLLEYTRKQGMLLQNEDMDMDDFQSLIDQKGLLVNRLNEMDEVFDALFRRVKDELEAHRERYVQEIREMQEILPHISDLSVQIQALEQQNDAHFKEYVAGRKKVIRDFHVNNKAVSHYHQNQRNAYQADQSYFFDKTK